MRSLKDNQQSDALKPSPMPRSTLNSLLFLSRNANEKLRFHVEFNAVLFK